MNILATSLADLSPQQIAGLFFLLAFFMGGGLIPRQRRW